MASETSSNITSSLEVGLGASLRQKREALGWRIEDVAEHLKIRASVLEALEHEQYEILPDRVYLLGFLKSYASFLGLDSQKVIAELSQKNIHVPSSGKIKVADISFLQGHKTRTTPIGLFLGVGCFFTACVYGGWYYVKGYDIPFHHNSPALEQAPVAQNDAQHPLNVADNQALTAPVLGTARQEGSTINGVEGGNMGDAQREDARNDIAQPLSPPQNLVSPAETASSPFVRHDMSNGEDKKKDAQPVDFSASDKAAGAQPASDKKLITLYAGEDSWISIKDSHNKIIFSGILKKGGQWQGDDSQGPYFLTTGNAGGVYFKSENMQTPPLGNKGIVRHDLKITADDIMSGKFGALSTASDLEHHDKMH